MNAGSIVVVHLVNPSEKYWGVLENLTQAGVTVRAINLSSFEDWVGAVANQSDDSIGLATIFFPLTRVERMFLDEPMGSVESLSQSFERRVGASVEVYLGLGDEADALTN